MAKDSSPRRKRQWFARRQVYLRTGQDSHYVELSPMLQIGVALGFAAFALWLAGATYGAVTSVTGEGNDPDLLAKLSSTEQALAKLEDERAATLEDSARIADLEQALTDAQALATDASAQDEARELQSELEQAHTQLDDLQLRFSESKADYAALQAKYKTELSATTDASQKTAEEAATLHEQLEEAFGQIESLQAERDSAMARLTSASDETDNRGEALQRNSALLMAATSEIERLKEALALADEKAEEDVRDQDLAANQLQTNLDEALAARSTLENEVTSLQAQLDETQDALQTSEATAAASVVAGEAGGATEADVQVAIDAALQSHSIDADLREADLLAVIDDLRAELDTQVTEAATSRPVDESKEIATLRERVKIAEAELERLLLSGLKSEDEGAAAQPKPRSRQGAQAEPAPQVERLRASLLAAQADNIKLTADVDAAKKRLAEQASANSGQIARPDNSDKLEQQLASTRTRVQQLNKALADAKLREVAIDLALISVIPSPSPPAPR